MATCIFYDQSTNITINYCRKRDSIPKIGMKFATIDEAYEYYNKYALQVGFSVRKHNVRKNTSKVITMRYFTCSREGTSRKRSPSKGPPKTKRLEQRIGCNAHMQVNICNKGVYEVTSFEPEHNHETTTPTKTKLLRSHREISQAQKMMGDLADAAGIGVKDTIELLAKQAGGRRHLTFIPDDYKNYLRTKRENAMVFGDAGALMQYLQNR
jgi:zinc finger SWIM domain-containing protein 3